jgi:type VI secretion system secreted protein VgrG
MAKWTQSARKLAIATPLGDDELILQNFSLEDEVSRPFVCEVKLFSENAEIDFNAIVGENVTLRLEQGDGGTRFINGYVSRFVQGGGDSTDAQHLYYATIVPWLWFLTRSTDCRIFQEMTVPEILNEIFGDFGCSEMVEDTLTGTYDTLEYVVQYRETAFNFVSRLMEHEGIYYFFKHEDGKHKLVLADAPSAHEEAAGYEEIPLHDTSQMDKQGVTEWSHEARLVPGRYALRDFDFKVPDKDLNSEKAITQKHALAGWAVFDYPGDYIEKSSGDTKSEARMEELAAQHSTFHAKSDARGLYVGCKFSLTGSPRDDGDYVITSLTAAATEDSVGSRSKAPEELFRSEFTCIPADVQYRPRRTTEKPLINGPQTAIVTGQEGEEITTDEFGRVKVHFHWDRWNEADDKSSCWIRVAQLWAGKKFGSMFLPRQGQEVIVEFLEGDPDRPIITGRVYNGECQVPYALPDNKTMSTIKSQSTKDADGDDTFNELRFEDKVGEEQIFIHGAKDLHFRIVNDTVEWVGNDRHLTVVNDQIEEIQHDRNELVKNDHKEEIKNDRNVKIGGKEAIEVVGSHSHKVKDNVIQEYGADQSTKVTKQLSIKADTIVIEATTNMTLKVGGATIAIEDGSMNIKVNGDLTIETDGASKTTATGDFNASGATATVEGKSAADLKGKTTTVTGSGKAAVTGGQVMLG